MKFFSPEGREDAAKFAEMGIVAAVNPGTLLLFAKYPRPGAAKTRLIPALGANGAARLAEAFLLDLLERLARADFGDVRRVLCFDPPEAAGDFRTLLAARGNLAQAFTLEAQAPGGLGERLAAGLQAHAQHAVVFIGADAPDLPLDEIAAGFEHARSGRAYLQRACDGGYVLLALPAGSPRSVFSEMAWSSAATAEQQAARIRQAPCALVESPRIWSDVDEPGDLAGLKERLEKTPETAPRTLSALRELL